MAKKVNRRLVALSTSAVAAVYLVGYTRTAPAAARIAAAERPPTATPSPLPAPAPIRRPSTATPSPAVALPAPVAPGASGPGGQVAGLTYRDGTYSGYGTSRRGDVEVAVVVQDGRIVSADITRCMTQYPQARIAKLPAQVVVRQSAQVDRVSGATYSTTAYQDAVRAALAKAQTG